jgi:hypothetical protein
MANFFRLYLHSAALNLLVRLRRGIADPPPADPQAEVPVEALAGVGAAGRFLALPGALPARQRLCPSPSACGASQLGIIPSPTRAEYGGKGEFCAETSPSPNSDRSAPEEYAYPAVYGRLRIIRANPTSAPTARKPRVFRGQSRFLVTMTTSLVGV